MTGVLELSAAPKVTLRLERVPSLGAVLERMEALLTEVEALRKHVPGFAALEVEEDGVEAEPHPPPGPTLVEVRRRDE